MEVVQASSLRNGFGAFPLLPILKKLPRRSCPHSLISTGCYPNQLKALSSKALRIQVITHVFLTCTPQLRYVPRSFIWTFGVSEVYTCTATAGPMPPQGHIRSPLVIGIGSSSDEQLLILDMMEAPLGKRSQQVGANARNAFLSR